MLTVCSGNSTPGYRYFSSTRTLVRHVLKFDKKTSTVQLRCTTWTLVRHKFEQNQLIKLIKSIQSIDGWYFHSVDYTIIIPQLYHENIRFPAYFECFTCKI